VPSSHLETVGVSSTDGFVRELAVPPTMQLAGYAED